MGQEPSANIRAKMTKDIIKAMPVWGYFDQKRAELKFFQHQMETWLEKLNQELRLHNALPTLNLTNRLENLPYNEAKSDQDIVRLMLNKTSNGYNIIRIGTKKENVEPKREPEDDIRILEAKIMRHDEVFAMVNYGKPWVRCKVKYKHTKPRVSDDKPWLLIKLETLMPKNKEKKTFDATKYSIARTRSYGDRLKPTKRVIAGITESKLMPGIIGNEPSEENKSRYLVLMDDGSASYFKLEQVYPIVGQSPIPWKDSRYLSDLNSANDLILAYARYFFANYPKRHIIEAPVGTILEIMKNGSLVSAKVIEVDCDTIRVLYRDDTEESLYRGSPRLMRKEGVVSKQLSNLRSINDFFPRIILLANEYFKAGQRALDEDILCLGSQFRDSVVISSRPNTARKSTTQKREPKTFRVKLDQFVSNEDREHTELTNEEIESRKHACTHDCLTVPNTRTEIHVLDMATEFIDKSDLRVPLLLGWKRQLRTITSKKGKKGSSIVYQAPCKRYFTGPFILRNHLVNTGSRLDIDYFSFEKDLNLNRKTRDLDANYYVGNIAVHKETGEPTEKKFISLMNAHTEERLPQDFEYVSETFPHRALAKKNFSFNEEFKSYCDCENDCRTRSSCACHQLNEQAAGKYAYLRGNIAADCQYKYKRLEAQISTGIFECNSKCKCSSRCPNRVVQNGIRVRLQVHKTLNKGWGVITLDDIPSGAFICTYAAELLDDADQYGDSDMYYADLDYITVLEDRKLGFESDDSDEGVETVCDDEPKTSNHEQAGKRKASSGAASESDENESYTRKENGSPNSSSSSDTSSISSYEGSDPMEVDNNSTRPEPKQTSRYPKRKNQQQQKPAGKNQHVREDRRQSDYKRIHELLGTRDFTLDARMQGNIGRFFNHSCDPNAHCQNVFIETHDLRFPVVAFFANKLIKAMDEITWNYNYKMGTIEGRRIDCHCGASNCRGRIL